MTTKRQRLSGNENRPRIVNESVRILQQVLDKIWHGSTSTTTEFSPETSDGLSLGSTTRMWSDLFLASGGVINWNNGAYTITQASSTLTFSGAIAAGSITLTTPLPVASGGTGTKGGGMYAHALCGGIQMTVTATPVFVQTPSLGVNSITTSTGTSAVTVVTGGANGSKIVSLSAQNNTTVAAIITVSLSTGGGTAKRLGAATVALSTDNTGVATDMLSTSIALLPIDNDGQKYLFLPSASHSLTVTASASLSTATSGKTVDFVSVYADF